MSHKSYKIDINLGLFGFSCSQDIELTIIQKNSKIFIKIDIKKLTLSNTFEASTFTVAMILVLMFIVS